MSSEPDDRKSAGPRPEARRLKSHVARLEGPRHPETAADRHAAAARYAASRLEELGYRLREQMFRHAGRDHRNVGATHPAGPEEGPRLLVGAHYDTVAGTPGADDNASGVAVLLEAARLLRTWRPSLPLELVAFDLEEPRAGTYRLGSRAWVRGALQRDVSYRGALILEMVGYTDDRPGSQRIPWPLRWRDLPERGDFLAAVGDWKSKRLIEAVTAACRDDGGELEVVTTRIPFRGWLVPQSRLSDNASFWDQGYPALMLTDTAFLRNPYYHGPGDRAETLDYAFMEQVVSLVTRSIRLLAD